MAGGMNAMTACAGVLRNRAVGKQLGRIDGTTANGSSADCVTAVPPAEHIVATEADRGPNRRLAQEVTKTVVVGIMACRAMHLAMRSQRQRRSKYAWVLELPIAIRQRKIKAKSDRVVIGEILRQVGWSGRNRPKCRDNGLRLRARGDQSDGHHSVVAAQAHLGRAARLIDSCIRRAALIDAVIRGAIESIPQGRLARRVVRRVAENANLLFIDRVKLSRARSRKVVR